MTHTGSQVLLIGLDGATWRVLEPWARSGQLPHVAALMERGAWGTLRSTVPAVTLPAWASCMTGKNPGRHGIYAFRQLAARSYDRGRLVNATDLRAPRVWNIAGRAGKRVGVVNVPPSYPLRPVNGFVVSCMLTPPGERSITDPPELATELGAYRIDTDLPRGLRRGQPDYEDRAVEYLDALREQTASRAAAILRLTQRHPCDLLCAVFYAPDRAQHFFWELVEEGGAAPPRGDTSRPLQAVRNLYAALDDAVGRLVAAAGPDATVVLVSDHGFAPAPHRIVRINRWLADRGLLRQRPLWRTRRKVIRKLFPAGWRARYDTLDHIMVDRAKTKAWGEALDEPGTAGIWIHVADRYPRGCVASDAEYRALQRQIQAGLRELRDSDGAPAFRAVHLRDEAYDGPFVSEAPDVLGVCAEGYGIGAKPLGAELRARDVVGTYDEAEYSGHTGVHDPFGVYLLAGPVIAARGAQPALRIESIAPTVLYLLGVAVPRSMDGEVATALIDPALLEHGPVRFSDDPDDDAPSAPGWSSPEDEALVADRLRQLGYLE
jgi:predicted AlkP superfamily phosphohydrolase/phosphomutase